MCTKEGDLLFWGPPRLLLSESRDRPPARRGPLSYPWHPLASRRKWREGRGRGACVWWQSRQCVAFTWKAAALPSDSTREMRCSSPISLQELDYGALYEVRTPHFYVEANKMPMARVSKKGPWRFIYFCAYFLLSQYLN